jgi:hypothetical protein
MLKENSRYTGYSTEELEEMVKGGGTLGAE